MWQEVGGEGDLETAESLGSVAGAARRWGSLPEYRQGWCVWRRFHIALLNLRSVPDLRRLPHFPSCSSHEQLWVLTSCRAAFLGSRPGAVLMHLGRPVLPQQVHQCLGARDSMLAGELHPYCMQAGLLALFPQQYNTVTVYMVATLYQMLFIV